MIGKPAQKMRRFFLFFRENLLTVSFLLNYTLCIESIQPGQRPAVSRRVSMATEFSRTLSLPRKERGFLSGWPPRDLGVSQALFEPL